MRNMDVLQIGAIKCYEESKEGKLGRMKEKWGREVLYKRIYFLKRQAINFNSF